MVQPLTDPQFSPTNTSNQSENMAFCQGTFTPRAMCPQKFQAVSVNFYVPAENKLHLLLCEPSISALHVLHCDVPEIYIYLTLCTLHGPGGCCSIQVSGLGAGH